MQDPRNYSDPKRFAAKSFLSDFSLTAYLFIPQEYLVVKLPNLLPH